MGDVIAGILARVGVGPIQLLTTQGRKTGLPRTNPVVLVAQDTRQWLVAPYGAVAWVLNARASGRVLVCRGRRVRGYTVRELSPSEAGPVLKCYIDIASATRSSFDADRESPVEDFIREAHRHPVFELSPVVATR